MPARFVTVSGPVRRTAAWFFTVLAIGSCGAISLASAGDSRLDDVMRELAQRRHGHAAFVERQYLAILERPLESSGELFYDAPGRIEKRTLLPKPSSLMLDGGTVSIRRGSRTYAASLRDYPQLASLMGSIRATLAGDRAALEQSYALSFAADGIGWTLTLVPRDLAVAAVVARMRISGTGATVLEVEVRRADGDRSVMTIHELPGQ